MKVYHSKFDFINNFSEILIYENNGNIFRYLQEENNEKKKIIALVVLVLAVAGGVFFFLNQNSGPEKQIIGT